eukprot:scaffold32223_cov83-Cyclotella_meneghiniana.AAC.8
MFATHPSLSTHFEPPVFSQGVPSREIRNRLKLLQYSRRAGLIPDVEWDGIVRALTPLEKTPNDSTTSLERGMDRLLLDSNADFISDIEQNQYEVIDPFRFLAETVKVEEDSTPLECNEDPKTIKKKKQWPQTKTTSLVPISPHRKGSAEDISVPYSMELWRKAKSLSRDRSVLGCTLAHLIAMRKLVDGQFDFILEDNVRAFIGNDNVNESCSTDPSWTGWSCECANRIWDIIELSGDMGISGTNTKSDNLSTCHLRYFGWLGSLPNLAWVYQNHIPRKGQGSDNMKIFPFPTNSDFELDSIPTDKESAKLEKMSRKTEQLDTSDSAPHFSTPGGTAVFGTFAYTISAQAYQSLITNLQNDVGALMWKSKKMRAYHAKPIDKILPRHIRSEYGEECVHLPEKVAFVRCPMLGSLLHPQWEVLFCESTELQYKLYQTSCLDENVSVWNSVWLTDEERLKVEHRKRCRFNI